MGSVVVRADADRSAGVEQSDGRVEPSVVEPAVHHTSTVLNDPRTEGTAVGSLVLNLGLIGPDRLHRSYEAAAGFSVQVVGKRTRWPVMVGMGGGVLALDDSFWFGTTTKPHALEIRHAELVMRVEPFWGAVRPFAEGLFGLAVLWQTLTLQTSTGDELDSIEQQRDAAALFGLSLGVDVRLLSLQPRATHAHDLVLTLGCRRMYTTPIERVAYANDDDGAVYAWSVRVPLAMWQPFVAVSFSFDTRAATKYARGRALAGL